MLTQMTEKDWEVAVEVFRAVRSKRGEPGHDDRQLLDQRRWAEGYSGALAGGERELAQPQRAGPR